MPSPPLSTTPSSPYHSYTSPLPEHSIPPSRSTPSNDDIEAVIKMATSTSQTPADRPLRDTRTQLFVGNLPYRVRWQDLKDLFRRAGTVLRADVSLGPDNRSRGYGTVLLATAEDAGRAIDMFNGYCWQTRVLEVRPDRLGATLDDNLNINSLIPNAAVPFIRPSLNIPSVNSVVNSFNDFAIPVQGNGELLSGGTGMRSLFVGNLPFHIQWQDLKDLFRAAGAVTRADVALGPDGRSRGFGTVTFVTEDGAERARRMFDGYEFNGRPLKVHYDKFAQSQNIPMIGVSPQATSNSVLSSYDTLPQLASPLSRFEPQLPLDLQRSHLEATALDTLSPAQLDALLTQPRRLSLASPSLTSPAVLSQPSSHVHSPALLQTQGQALAHSLGVSVVQPLALPSSTHNLSRPRSLTGSPHPVSSNVSSSASSVHNFGGIDPLVNASDLTLVTDLNTGIDLKLATESLTSRSTSFSSPRPSLSAGSSQASSFSSCGSRRPNVSTGSSRTDALSDTANIGFGSQRQSFSSSARPSFGAASAEKPSFGASSTDRLSFSTASSERPILSTTASQRLSINSTTSQKPAFGQSSQRSTAHLSTPFLDDDGPSLSSGPASILGTSKPSVLRPVAMSLSLPPPKTGSQLGLSGSTSKTPSPPSLSGGHVGSTWTDPSGARSQDARSSPQNTSEHTSPRAALLAQSILNMEPSSSPDSIWAASKAQSSKEPSTSKANGSVDYVTTALGSLGLRRANRAQSRQSEEKKSSTPESQSHSSSTSPRPQGQGKKQQPSSHRHPGPIALPPPTTFTLPPGVVFSPHAHPQSPMYHPGYPVSPMHPHPMGSPLHHPMGSPLHHPAHVHSPLHHPGHPQYGPYPHHPHLATPMLHGVITPHGLPPITPSMPPFTFLPPPAQAPSQNGNGHDDKGSEERIQHTTQHDGRQIDPSKHEIPPQVSQPTHYPPVHAPPHGMQYMPQVPPPMFSPGIPLSPGIMVPLSPGMMPPAVSMPMAPVPMTPGVALTPGVTMASGAFWSHAPWINPAVGAPVHSEHSHSGAEGYFPPVSQPSGDTGYFPPVSSVANEIPREGHGFASSESDDTPGREVRRGREAESTSRSTSRSQVSSPDPSSKSSQEFGRKGGTQTIKRSTSAQYEGGTPKRNGLLHRESDPEVTTATSKGGTSKEA